MYRTCTQRTVHAQARNARNAPASARPATAEHSTHHMNPRVGPRLYHTHSQHAPDNKRSAQLSDVEAPRNATIAASRRSCSRSAQSVAVSRSLVLAVRSACVRTAGDVVAAAAKLISCLWENGGLTQLSVGWGWGDPWGSSEMHQLPLSSALVGDIPQIREAVAKRGGGGDARRFF